MHDADWTPPSGDDPNPARDDYLFTIPPTRTFNGVQVIALPPLPPGTFD